MSTAVAGTKRKAEALSNAEPVVAAAKGDSTQNQPLWHLLNNMSLNVADFDEAAFAKFPLFRELKKKAHVKNKEKQNVARLFIDVNPRVSNYCHADG